ncbi:hypothetical protein SAMN04489724_1857 [Algoriphagus locisalis]|uniref:Uncharacterized protein n=1 Tax=Algoriphagus locisalis TaxID=305507 RepID=A0A1I7ACS9_9BACT|nr:hypothetical protein [Algoriphagus locisalis]SFT72688.1 hypothetical protein SAMN04489724_1857 [Algoriphagus locisalis]
MNTSVSFDPSYRLAKVFIRLGMIFSAVMVAVFLYMIYLASLGILTDWDLSIQTEFYDYYPTANSVFWHVVFFSMPALGFLISFLVLGWLGKKIELENQATHQVH